MIVPYAVYKNVFLPNLYCTACNTSKNVYIHCTQLHIMCVYEYKRQMRLRGKNTYTNKHTQICWERVQATIIYAHALPLYIVHLILYIFYV